MPDSSLRLYWLVGLSLLLATFAAIFPLDPRYAELRPELMCVFVIYWVVHAPQHMGVTLAWMVGLLQGVLEGVTWGGHAVALAIVAYICIVAQRRIKNYSLWHQTIWIFVLVGFHQVMVNWFQGLAGYKSSPQGLILSTSVSALFWPLVSILLLRVRLAYRLH